MKNFLFLLFCLASLFIPESIAQNVLKSSIGPRQKIFIHTDRDYYTSGGQIFYKVYVRSSSGKLSSLPSENLYLDLINSEGQIVESQIVLINQGIGGAQIAIDPSLPTGRYVIRAFTDYIKGDPNQYFRKIIHINSRVPEVEMTKLLNDTIYLNLLPEGGSLVEGIENRISFIATNAQGFPIQAEFQGKYGNENYLMSCSKNGLGEINIMPRSGLNFSINSQETIKYSFPEILESGVNINCTVNNDKLTIKLNGNISEKFNLLIHQDGDLIYEETEINGDRNFNYELIELPPGIIHCTILTETGIPISERLIFNHFGIGDFNIDIATNKEEFKSREKVIMQLDLYNDEGEALPSEISVSVVDDYIVKPIINNPNIVAHNYLNSELRNLIINPVQYFNWEDQLLINKTDLLMRIYGWRKFKELNNQPDHKGIIINGLVTRKDRDRAKIKAQGFISFLNNNLSVLPFVTDEEGNLNFNNLQFFGEQDIIIQAEVFNKRKSQLDGDEIKMSGNRNVDIKLIDRKAEYVHFLDSLLFYDLSFTKDQASVVAETEIFEYSIDEDEDIAMSIDLDEISISEEKMDEVIESYRKSMFYVDPNDRINTSRIQNIGQYRDIYDILRGRVTGLILDGPDEGMAARKKVILRGYTAGGLLTSDAASFFINGNYVPQVQAEAINVLDIAFIDVVKSLSQLAAYGEAGVNGIVFIYLKPPGLRPRKNPETYEGILSTTIEGYAEMRTFYKPNYSIENPEEFDNRITIHWEPSIAVDENGTAYIEFYTADKSTIYRVDVQGVTDDGLPISANSTIIIR